MTTTDLDNSHLLNLLPVYRSIKATLTASTAKTNNMRLS